MNAKRKKAKKIILAVVLIVVTAIVAAASYFVVKLWIKIPTPTESTEPTGEYVTEIEDDNTVFGTVFDVTDATSLKGFLREWWYQGGDEMIRYNKNVINILLIGEDNDGKVGSRHSDTIMLASINRKTDTITLLSFLRDSYCYFNVNDGDEYYHRINSSYFYGGPQGLMDTISHLYKIKVDKYISIDFASFPKLIDALGGVTVDVTEEEAKFINRTAPSQKHNFPSGPNTKLTGQQALIYSRIRKLDSDFERTNRQQKVIQSILDSAKGASVGRLYNALDLTLPYVRTNYSRAELFTMIPGGIGWLDFGMVNMNSPTVTGTDSNAINGTINGMSILIVDYPKAAQQVQMALYGESNIDLTNDSQRNAYISSLFRSALQYEKPVRTTSQHQQETEAQTDAFGETDSDGSDIPNETEPQEETQPERVLPTLPIWPFGRTETTEQQQ